MKMFALFLLLLHGVYLFSWEVSVYPRSYVLKQFDQTATEFAWRFEKYGMVRPFSSYHRNKTEEELRAEFRRLKDDRFQIWYNATPGWYNFVEVNEDFLFAETLFYEDCFRAGNCIAFDYNNTHSSFNSSNIVIGPDRFLAMEGPRSTEETAFFSLLTTYQVTHLVRLTPEFDTRKKCHPYWKGRTEITDSGTFLQVSLRGGSPYSIRYYEIEDWVDHDGIDPHRLIELIQTIRSTYDPEQGLIAVHCSAGVGRTGTFIAAFILLSEIDRQLETGEEIRISIEELVFKLSLQRKYMVTRLAQYQTLHDVVAIYSEEHVQATP